MPKTETVFRSDHPGHVYGNACAGGYFENDTIYADEFQGIADAEVDRVATAGGYMVPPRFRAICFNYRHALELTLKEIIRDAEEAIQLTQSGGGLTVGQAHRQGASSRKRLETIHSLGELLDLVESRLRVLGAGGLEPIVRQLVKEFDALDPKGQTFRYSRDSKGALTMAEQRQFDVLRIRAAVRDAMRELRRGHNWACITAQQCQEYLHDTAP